MTKVTKVTLLLLCSIGISCAVDAPSTKAPREGGTQISHQSYPLLYGVINKSATERTIICIMILTPKLPSISNRRPREGEIL